MIFGKTLLLVLLVLVLAWMLGGYLRNHRR
jgi:hypothetical protein